MQNRDIREFAEILVRQVRDEAIRNCDVMLQHNSAAPHAKRWRKAVVNPESLRPVIPDVVDEAIFALLRAIDEGGLRLKFVSAAGSEVDLTAEGMSELAGWYVGSGGWRAQFARERYVDDFKNLTKWPPDPPP
jgi:hypothetical protein